MCGLRFGLISSKHRTAALDRDPLLELIGLVDEPWGPRDMAEEHDLYLRGAVKLKRLRRQ